MKRRGSVEDAGKRRGRQEGGESQGPRVQKGGQLRLGYELERSTVLILDPPSC